MKDDEQNFFWFGNGPCKLSLGSGTLQVLWLDLQSDEGRKNPHVSFIQEIQRPIVEKRRG